MSKNKPKLLSRREIELFHLAVYYAICLNDCNPEVGMGPTYEMVAKKVASQLSFDVDGDDIAEVVEVIRGS